VTGLSFDLTEEQEQLRQTVRDFAERECPKDVARRLEAAKDELAAASVTQAPRLTRPAAQA
jgi:alkylation response protein AidB-like acyl-CoA dehydrogenase